MPGGFWYFAMKARWRSLPQRADAAALSVFGLLKEPPACSTAPLSCSAARCTSPPITMTVRLATVGPLLGTSAVSGTATSTFSYGRPSVSAAICAKTVLVPCPISVLAASTRTRPSRVSATPASLARKTSPEPVKPMPCCTSESPMPRHVFFFGSRFHAAYALRLAAQPLNRIVFSSTSPAPTLLARTWPVCVTEPWR